MSPPELLGWLGADGLEAPARLLPLLLLAAAVLGLSARRPLAALPWPGLAEAQQAGASTRDPLRAVELVLRGAGLLCLAVALAEPFATRPSGGGQGDGLDLALVVDISGSMRAVDAEAEGQPRTRIELAREVVTRFALHRVAEGDRVGLVVFGGRAYTQSPLTADSRLLEAALSRVEPGPPNEPTALGDGLALAVRRVSGAGDSGSGEGPIEGRLVVLLTDGRSNAGAIPVDVATGIAAARRVRVHTVGIGAERHSSRERVEAVTRGTILTDLDTATLRQVAARTGGRFFQARTTTDLDAVYREIDALERIPRDRLAESRHIPVPEPFLLLAGGLLLGEIGLARLLFRRLP